MEGDGSGEADDSADTHAAAASARPWGGLDDGGGGDDGDSGRSSDDGDESSGCRDANSVMVFEKKNSGVVVKYTGPAADSPVMTIACTRINRWKCKVCGSARVDKSADREGCAHQRLLPTHC